jgi:penicillin-binding protein 1A
MLPVVTTGLVLLLTAWARCGVQGCPDVRVLAAYRHGGGPLLLDRDGLPVGRLTPLARRTVPLGALPPHVPDAFVAIEDKRFRAHEGVDWRRVPGALLANLRSGGIEQGFSTITMQLARNVFPDRLPAAQRTLKRKALEIRVAGEIEDQFTKDEILELYLNHIYFGEGAYGIEAASQHYFGVPAAKLTLAQAATLAAIPRAPSFYDPRRHPENARARRDLVLTLMQDQERIGSDEAQQARWSRLEVPARPPRDRDADGFAPYFMAAIRELLEERFGAELYTEPMRVQTTLDRTIQQALQDELERQMSAVERGTYGPFRHPDYDPAASPDVETPYLQGAGIVIDARSGDVLAQVGGRDHDQSSFDRALDGTRQLGSAFKPFVYAAALQNGWTTVDLIEDEPLMIQLAGGRVYEPRNFDGRYSGPVTLRDALVRSLNIPAVRLGSQVGAERVAALAAAAGIHGEIAPTPSMALGTVSASPLEVALAYTPFATLGTAVRQPRWVVRVLDEEGRELWGQEAVTEPAMDPALAYVVTDVLRDVVDRGTGAGVRRVGYRGVAAGKTGTTTDGRDVWFAGYTPDLVGVVWMGLDRPATILPSAAGGQLGAPVWGRVMARAYRERPAPEPWAIPPGVKRLRADPVNGIVLAEWCAFGTPDARSEVFLEGHVPPTGCPIPPRRTIFGRTFGWFGDLFGDDQDEGEDGRQQPEREGARIRIRDDLSPSVDRAPGSRR